LFEAPYLFSLPPSDRNFSEEEKKQSIEIEQKVYVMKFERAAAFTL